MNENGQCINFFLLYTGRELTIFGKRRCDKKELSSFDQQLYEELTTHVTGVFIWCVLFNNLKQVYTIIVYCG